MAGNRFVVVVAAIVDVVLVMVIVIRWCEKTGKANKKETSFYKSEFRYLTDSL